MTSLPTDEELEQMTPMMGQFYRLKRSAPDAIIFFRMGDFYEIFGSDAEDVAPQLNLVLTSREKGNQTRIPFCGVPHHSAKSYWLKLLNLGYKVAIAEQVEDPALVKGLVKREIVKMFTPGCIDDLDGLPSEQSNYLMVVYEHPSSKKISVVISDISTGELRAGSLKNVSELLPLILKYAPREIVTRRFYKSEIESLLESQTELKVVMGTLPEGPLRDPNDQKEILQSHFGDLKLDDNERPVVAGFLSYLKSLKASTDQFLGIKPLLDPETMNLHETVRRDLELFETVQRRQSEGSLFREINRTLTPMGARLLHHSMANPFLSRTKIKERHEGIQLLLDHPESLDLLRTQLKNIPDLERLFIRAIGQKSSPLELAKIRATLNQVHQARDLLATLGQPKSAPLSEAITNLGVCHHVFELLSEALTEDADRIQEPLAIFNQGYDETLDRLRSQAENGEDMIKTYESSLRESTGIASLKIKSHKTYGLLIEVTKSNLSKVPEGFIRRQTMVNNERFVTLELQELDDSLAHARDHAIARESLLYQELLQKLVPFKEAFHKLVSGVALWDLLQGFAQKAKSHQFIAPRFSNSGEVLLLGSRHPVVESFVGRHEFTPNDIRIAPKARSLVITGPNMAGKSTVMRQVALSALLHQIGSYVPATEAVLPIFDNIFTRVGASDDLALGKSTFMVEMSEASLILRCSTENTLVILDEVGRGTSTEDGTAIAFAILDDLTNRIGCYCLFATHFHNLIPEIATMPSVKLLQTEVISGTQIKFTHRIIEGAANSSFGIEVAELAGVPTSVIDKARDHLKRQSEASYTHPKEAHKEQPSYQATLQDSAQNRVAAPDPRFQEILSRLEALNLNRMTPLQALNQISRWQETLDSKANASLFEN